MCQSGKGARNESQSSFEILWKSDRRNGEKYIYKQMARNTHSKVAIGWKAEVAIGWKAFNGC